MKIRPTVFENVTFRNDNTLEGLKLALKHCTKYEDRMFLCFLIRKEMSKMCYFNLSPTADIL